MGQVDTSNVEHVFTYQPPEPGDIHKFNVIHDATLACAKAILEVVPQSADRSTALRKLREVRMDCNAAIALNGMI